jgi:hypothetical protein
MLTEAQSMLSGMFGIVTPLTVHVFACAWVTNANVPAANEQATTPRMN